jgi:hypothetical protein
VRTKLAARWRLLAFEDRTRIVIAALVLAAALATGTASLRVSPADDVQWAANRS